MPYIAPEVVQEVKRMDLLIYLKNYEPFELVHFSGNTYTTKIHDSLKISNGKWMWWGRGIGTDFIGDANGNDKNYSFSIPAEGTSTKVHLFESAIDLLLKTMASKKRRTKVRFHSVLLLVYML